MCNLNNFKFNNHDNIVDETAETDVGKEVLTEIKILLLNNKAWQLEQM